MKIKQLSDLVSNKIVNSEINNIAISGPWGSGKTTLLNSIKEKVKGEYVSIEIELWNFEHKDFDIFSHILLELSDKIGIIEKYRLPITKRLKKLGGKMVDIAADNSESFKSTKEVSKAFIDFFKDAKSSELLDQLDDEFQKSVKHKNNSEIIISFFNRFLFETKKKWLILFDDIDRCSEENIIKILAGIQNILFKLNSNNIFL